MHADIGRPRSSWRQNLLWNLPYASLWVQGALPLRVKQLRREAATYHQEPMTGLFGALSAPPPPTCFHGAAVSQGRYLERKRCECLDWVQTAVDDEF
jgi:hypothetical protein